MILVDAKLGKFKLSFFILSEKGQFLGLSVKLSLILLHECILILLKLNLTLLVESVFLLSNKLLLLFLMLSDGALRLCLQLVLVVLHLIAEHATAVLRFHLNFVLHL
mgnify:CR=1 FL=1